MRNIKKDITVAVASLIAVVYIINPGAGFLEFIPDNLPIIGNLDEATAVLIIISAFKYFGVDLSNLFSRDEEVDTKAVSKKN